MTFDKCPCGNRKKPEELICAVCSECFWSAPPQLMRDLMSGNIGKLARIRAQNALVMHARKRGEVNVPG